jgi:hypothetical protein
LKRRENCSPQPHRSFYGCRQIRFKKDFEGAPFAPTRLAFLGLTLPR